MAALGKGPAVPPVSGDERQAEARGVPRPFGRSDATDLATLCDLRRQIGALYRHWLRRRIVPSRLAHGELWKDARVTEGLAIHGLDHWARVGAVAVALLRARLAAEPGAGGPFRAQELENAVLVAAFFHDLQRANEGHDAEHGQRAANLLGHLRPAWRDVLPDDRLAAQVIEAVRVHDTRPSVRDDATLVVRCLCTADRLDRPRFGGIVDLQQVYRDLDVGRWQGPAEALISEDRASEPRRSGPG